MKDWQYKQIYLSPSLIQNYLNFDAELNAHGHEGWELVVILELPKSPGSGWRAIFKRERP